MSTTYDDMLARAAEDMLTDIPEVQPYKDTVWIVEESVGEGGFNLTAFHKPENAMAFAERTRTEYPCIYVDVYKLEVR